MNKKSSIQITSIALLIFSFFCFNRTMAQEKAINADKLGFPKGKKVLLLHCDDAGMCEEANIAVQTYFLKGDVKSASVMMPCPNAEEMVEWAKKHPGSDIGVHLTLTAEWKNYRWGPLTDPEKVPGLIDPDGKFWHEVPDVVMHASPKEVEMEIHAQIDRMIELGFRPTHIDTHMGTLYGSNDYLRVFLKTAEEYNIPANGIYFEDPVLMELFKAKGYPLNDETMEILRNYKLPKVDLITDIPGKKTYEEFRDGFMEMINTLKPGLIEIYFHPSILTENLKSITNSWRQREFEAKIFSDPEIKQFFKENDIILTTWSEVMEKFNKTNNLQFNED